MAKRCLDKIIVDGVDYPLMQLNDFSIFNNYTGWDTNCSNAGYSYISSYGSDIMAIGGDRWISYGEHKYWDIENSNDAFIGLIGFNRNVSTKNICFDENDLDCRTRNSYVSSNQNMNMWCTIIVDDETELGFAIIVRQFPNGGTKDAWIYNDSNNDYAYCKKIYQCFGNVAQKITSNGGGATHIAKVTGQLKDLSSYTSDILMVSGGGGGGLLVGDTDYSGKEAGGISGSGDNSADQSTGNAFGQGESGTNVSGGGSGLYGGYKGTSAKSGGAGSGYIGNSLVSNKKMVGYNVPTSSAESTKTESINEVSAIAVSGKPKSGNGFARIKFLRDSDWRCLTSIEVDGTNCPLLQINDFSIIPNTYGGAETLIRRQSGIYIPSGVSDLGSEFAQPTISSGTVEKSTNYNDVIFRTTFGYNAQAYSNFNQNDIIYNTNTALMTHGFLLATEANTRLYIGIALNDTEEYGCCYFVAQYPGRNWTTENYSGGDGEIGYLIYSIFGNS